MGRIKRFPNLIMLIKFLPVLALSTAVCDQRWFSVTKRAKGNCRTTVTTPTLQMLLLVSVEGVIPNSFLVHRHSKCGFKIKMGSGDIHGMTSVLNMRTWTCVIKKKLAISHVFWVVWLITVIVKYVLLLIKYIVLFPLIRKSLSWSIIIVISTYRGCKIIISDHSDKLGHRDYLLYLFHGEVTFRIKLTASIFYIHKLHVLTFIYHVKTWPWLVTDRKYTNLLLDIFNNNFFHGCSKVVS